MTKVGVLLVIFTILGIESALKSLSKERMDIMKKICKQPSVCAVLIAELKKSRVTTQRVCVLKSPVLSTQNSAFWSAYFLQPGKTLPTPMAAKMQYSRRDNSLQPFEIIHKTIFSFSLSASQGLPACLPACHSVCLNEFGTR